MMLSVKLESQSDTKLIEYQDGEYLIFFDTQTGEYYSSCYLPIEYTH